MIIGGDFNARIGNIAPRVGSVHGPRESVDQVRCQRAAWMISLCEDVGVHILNGMEAGAPAPFTSGKPATG